MLYAIAKLLHLVAVILWIGPALGAYVFLFAALKERDGAKLLFVERITERILLLEHLALLAVIATGLVMVAATGWTFFSAPWLQLKLLAFAGVLVFELFDIWLAHHVVRRLLVRKIPLDAPEWSRADRWRRGLAFAALPVGGILVPAMLYLAVLKP